MAYNIDFVKYIHRTIKEKIYKTVLNLHFCTRGKLRLWIRSPRIISRYGKERNGAEFMEGGGWKTEEDWEKRIYKKHIRREPQREGG